MIKKDSEFFELIFLDDFADSLINISELLNGVAKNLVILHDAEQVSLALFEVISELDVCILYVFISDCELT